MYSEYFVLACALARAESRRYTEPELEQKAAARHQSCTAHLSREK